MAAIIFDFDGTIADSFDYVAEFMAKEAGIKHLTEEKRDELRGMSTIAMGRKLGFHWWNGPFLLFKGRRRMKNSIRHVEAFKGLPQLIKKVHAEGHELFILSTNSLSNVRNFLKHQQLLEYFLEIYGSVGMFSKSSALRRLLKDQKIDIEQAVYVGDELRDVEASQSIGLRVVAVSWGFANHKILEDAKPTALADNVDELMRILEEV